MPRLRRLALTISLISTLVTVVPVGIGSAPSALAAGEGTDEMFFYRADGLYRYYDIRPDGSIGTPIRQGSDYTNNWSAITAVDLDGDGRDEMFFYRADGLYRYYDIRPDGSIGTPIRQGSDYTNNWSAITAVDLDGVGGAGTPPSIRGGGPSSIDLYVFAKSGFDKYTRSPSPADQAWMREHYEFMAVWSPYFDSRLSWFPNGVEYSNTMGLKNLDHREWVLEDASGDPLYLDFNCSGGTCPQYAADVGNPQFRAWLIDHLNDQVAKGYAGVFLDDVNMLWRTSNGVDEIEPVDPRTGKTMTLAAWREYMADFVEQIRREVDGIIVHNPIWTADTPEFDDPSIARQLAAADWVQIEHGFNDKGLTGGNGRFSVRNLFAYVDWVHRLGTNVMWLEEDGGATKHESNLAAYLLTYAPGDVISTEDWDAIAPDTVWRGYMIELGAPLGARTESDGLFRREFQRGTVLINEPDNGTRTVGITGTRIDGTRVTRVTISPGTGIVVLKG
ncbi:MAG TPA: putative glycoside hydrolase [Acidimicrobiia bacterium]|nr:putative glycoside hydrolase [Acidimicrobiia bacterium]